jgi:hypothetical protein
MPLVPLGPLRALLALLALLFAYALGRAIARTRRNEPKPRVASWAIRFVLVLAAVSWRSGLDRITMIALVLSAIGLTLGFVISSRPKKAEDLSEVIFPHDQP